MASYAGSDDVFKEERTGIQFPERVGTFKRGKITPYEAEPGKPGVAIAYSAENAEVTIYVRGQKDEVKWSSEDYLKESLAAVKALEAQGRYSNVKTYLLNPDKEKTGWKSASFTSSSTNQFLISLISCKVAPGRLIKVRCTSGSLKDDLLASIRSFQDVVDAEPKEPISPEPRPRNG